MKSFVICEWEEMWGHNRQQHHGRWVEAAKRSPNRRFLHFERLGVWAIVINCRRNLRTVHYFVRLTSKNLRAYEPTRLRLILFRTPPRRRLWLNAPPAGSGVCLWRMLKWFNLKGRSKVMEALESTGLCEWPGPF